MIEIINCRQKSEPRSTWNFLEEHLKAVQFWGFLPFFILCFIIAAQMLIGKSRSACCRQAFLPTPLCTFFGNILSSLKLKSCQYLSAQFTAITLSSHLSLDALSTNWPYQKKKSKWGPLGLGEMSSGVKYRIVTLNKVVLCSWTWHYTAPFPLPSAPLVPVHGFLAAGFQKSQWTTSITSMNSSHFYLIFKYLN